MVEILNRTSKYTTLKIDNKLFNSIFGTTSKLISTKKTGLIKRPLGKSEEKKEYIESESEKKEILKIKKDMSDGKFVTLKDFLLQN